MMDQQAFTRSFHELLTATVEMTVNTLGGCIDSALTASSAVLESDGAALLLLDETEQLRLTGSSDEPARVLETTQIRLGLGPAVDVVRDDNAVRVADLCGDPRYHLLAEEVVSAGVRSVLAIPVTMHSTALGALNIYRSRPYQWTEEDVAGARSFAALFGLMLRVAVEAGPGVPEVERVQEVVSQATDAGGPHVTQTEGREGPRAG